MKTKMLQILRKTRKAMAMLLTLVMALSLIPIIAPDTASAAPPPTGNWIDSAETGWYTHDPSAYIFYINSAEQLAGLALLVNEGKDDEGNTVNVNGFLNKIIVLTSNIYLYDREWTPIGTAARPFLGTFSGYSEYSDFSGLADNWYAIFDLTITNTSANYNVGLFGIVGNSVTNGHHRAIVEHVRLVDPSIYIITSGINSTTLSVGGVCGKNYGTIRYCSVIRTDVVQVSAMGARGVGGICGNNSGAIFECYNEGTINGNEGNSQSGVGGICGENENGGVIENCYNEGRINSINKRVGGIAGYNNGLINHVYNMGTIAVDSPASGFGAICGINDGHIDYAAYWDGTMPQLIGGTPINETVPGEIKFGLSGEDSGRANGIKRLDGTTATQSSYEGLNFESTVDSPDTWEDFSGVGYPKLKNLPDVDSSDRLITFAHVFVTPPVDKETPNQEVTSSAKSFTAQPATWDTTAAFENANLYKVTIVLNAKKRFEFNDPLQDLSHDNVTINGNGAVIDVSSNSTKVILSYTFKAAANAVEISTQPKNLFITKGTPATLSVEAHIQYGTPEHKWYRNDGIEILDTGETLTTFNIPTSLEPEGSPYYFYCELSASDPGIKVQTREAVITVLPTPVPGIYVNPHKWDFASASYGYEPQIPRNATVSNTMSTALTTPINISLSAGAEFNLINEVGNPATQIFYLGAGTNANFTVVPFDNLQVGVHDATITLSFESPSGVYLEEEIYITFEVLPVIRDKPNITIDYIEETLKGFDSAAEYTIKVVGGMSLPDVSVNDKTEIDIFDILGVYDWPSDVELEIVRNGDSPNYLDSDPQSLTIPKRQPPPSSPPVVGVKPPKIGGKDGKITGTDATMEYNTDPYTTSDPWLICGDPSTEVVPGDYLVRYSAVEEKPGQEGKFRSINLQIEVEEYLGTLRATPTSLEIDYEEEKLFGFVSQGPDYLSDGITQPENIYRIRDEHGILLGTVYAAAGQTEISIPDSWMGTSVYIVVEGDGTDRGDSPPLELEIPERPPTPELYDTAPNGLKPIMPSTIGGDDGKIENMTEQTVSTDGMEYSKDEIPLVWIRYNGNDEVGAAGNYLVRIYADNVLERFASKPLVVTVPNQPGTPEDTPDISIDYIDETLKGFISGEYYSINGVSQLISSDVIPIATTWFSTTLIIIKEGDGETTTNSDPLNLPIPARPTMPALTAEKPELKNGNGKITGTDSRMQYRDFDENETNDEVRWVDIADSEIEVPPGDYEVRIKAATETSLPDSPRFKSYPYTFVSVPAWTAPQRHKPDYIKIDYVEETLIGFKLDGDETGEYTESNDPAENYYDIFDNPDGDGSPLATVSGPGGEKWIDISDITGIDLDDPDYKGQMVYIILRGDGEDFDDSEPFSLLIPPRPEGPGARLTGRSPSAPGIFDARIDGTTTAMVFKTDGTTDPWVECTAPSQFVGVAGKYLVRYKAVPTAGTTEGKFKSFETLVDVPERTEPPEENLTFTARQIGGAAGTADSAYIEITFSRSVTGLGLAPANIHIVNDTGEVVTGEHTDLGRGVYRIALTEVKTPGIVLVSVDKFGTFAAVTGSPEDPVKVQVYKNTTPPGRSITVGPQNRTLTAGTPGSVTFTAVYTGIDPGLPITLENINRTAGVTMDRAYSAATNSTVITIRTSASTPQGPHPMRITIDGVTSNIFYLVVDKSSVVVDPYQSYTVTVNGSYASNSGAGNYMPGEAVTIRAGVNGAYSFAGWTSANGLNYEDPNSPVTIFIMPAQNVTVTAGWSAANLTNVSFTAAQTGGVSGAANSTGILLNFSQQVTGLTAGHITISDGTGSAVRGTLSGSGSTYTVSLTNVAAQGTVNVSIANFGTFGVSGNPQQVQVYRDATARRITVGSQNGTLNSGASGTATFNVTTENITYSSAIRLDNINAVAGVNLETTYTTGNYTTVSISISSSTPQGSHPMRLTIDGVTSDTFYLVVGAYTSTTTYTVTVNGSYEYRTGSGGYAPGQVVTIQAGERGSYGFSGWTTSTSGVSFADVNSPTTTFTMPSRNVVINANWTETSQNITFTAEQTGGTSGTRNSAGIRLIFNQSVTGLSAGHITISDWSGSAVKGTLTGSGTTYTLNLTNVSAQGDIEVTIANFGRYTVTNNPQRTQVFWDYITRRITIGNQNGAPEAGTQGQANYSITTENIPSGSTIRLVNLDAVPGIALGTTSTTGSSTNVRISTIESTPEGMHPLQLIINGVASDIFYLNVGYNYSGTYGTYTLTVNGSFAQWTGAGRYAPGQTVTIQAGNSGGYTFDRWTSSGGISFANAYSTATTFIMPAYNVTVTANWSGGGGSGTGSSSGSSAWASSLIDLAISAGLVPRTLQSNYTQAITRAEFSSLVVTLYEIIKGTEITGRVNFSDTNDIYVEKAAAIGIVNGIGNNRFNPNGLLTREEAAVMIARLAKELGWTLPQRNTLFSDQNQISSWAVEAVGQVHAAGIMSGVGENTFAPKSQITREQSIVSILRLYDGRW